MIAPVHGIARPQTQISIRGKTYGRAIPVNLLQLCGVLGLMPKPIAPSNFAAKLVAKTAYPCRFIARGEIAPGDAIRPGKGIIAISAEKLRLEIMKQGQIQKLIQKCRRLLAACLLSVLLLLGFSQTSAWASTLNYSNSGIQLALAASSRFAAPSDEDLGVKKMTENRREKLREKRRQWQNQASSEAYDEAEQAAKEQESAKDKLNLEEITEENELVK